MDEPAIGVARGLHDRLAQRRVAVDHPRDLAEAALERPHVDELLDQLGRLRADDVAAEQLAVLRLADDLHEAGAVAVRRARADGAVLDLAGDDVVAGLLGLRLGQPERGDVRRAERRARDVDVDERVRRVPDRVLGGDDALVGRLVGERGAGDEVADRVDVRRRYVRSAPSTAMSPRSSSLTPGGVEPERLDVGAAARGDHEPVDLGRLVAVGERHAAVGALDVLDERARVDLHALLLQPALDELGDVGVLGRRRRGRAPRRAGPRCRAARTRWRSRRRTRRRRRRRSSWAAPRTPTPPRCR